jgi:hypothetical protein
MHRLSRPRGLAFEPTAFLLQGRDEVCGDRAFEVPGEEKGKPLRMLMGQVSLEVREAA